MPDSSVFSFDQPSRRECDLWQFSVLFWRVQQERERDLAVRSAQEELQQRLKEKEEEVRLAIEERELQKMAAVSGLDQQKDDLLQQMEMLNSVSGFTHLWFACVQLTQ